MKNRYSVMREVETFGIVGGRVGNGQRPTLDAALDSLREAALSRGPPFPGKDSFMAAKDLGTKWTCFKCGTKYYDMKKPDPVCPKCGARPQDNQSAKAGVINKKRLPPEVAEAPAVEADEEDEIPEEDTGDEAPPADDAVEEEDLDA